jgi:hypothetical protein
MQIRVCRCCGCEKSIDEFANAGIIKGVEYKRHLCVPCYSLSKKPRKQRIKEEYIEWKKTLKCSKCENNDYRVLEFHHRNPLEKEFTIANMVERGYSKERMNGEISKCDVLCANCHRIVHYEIRNGV